MVLAEDEEEHQIVGEYTLEIMSHHFRSWGLDTIGPKQNDPSVSVNNFLINC